MPCCCSWLRLCWLERSVFSRSYGKGHRPSNRSMPTSQKFVFRGVLRSLAIECRVAHATAAYAATEACDAAVSATSRRSRDRRLCGVQRCRLVERGQIRPCSSCRAMCACRLCVCRESPAPRRLIFRTARRPPTKVESVRTRRTATGTPGTAAALCCRT